VSAFRFRLARLLRVRAVEEEVARERWRSSEHAARALEETESVRRAELASSLELLLVLQSRPRIDAARVLAADLAIEGQRCALRDAAGHARTARVRCEEHRGAWIACKRAHEGLARLEARDRDLARRGADSKETRELDEVAGARAERSAHRTLARARASETRTEA
jgi:flagellar biosynthesis chaperone FliJ